MSVLAIEKPTATSEQIIRQEEILRVLICNANGEAIGSIFVPKGGALVVETRCS